MPVATALPDKFLNMDELEGKLEQLESEMLEVGARKRLRQLPFNACLI